MSSSVGAQEEKLKQLQIDVRRGEWPQVIETYEQERALRTAKITVMGDTVLHVAVSNRQEKVVEKMVNLVREENEVVEAVDGDGEESRSVSIVLGAENDKKNTPLHLAAAMGSVEMCKTIGGTDPSLIVRRNTAGETPLFRAALNGRKEAFLWLHYMYMASHGVPSTDFAHCIRDNGDTILHCAIAEEHFELAIEIVHLYKDLDLVKSMRRNKAGLSPLHLLASKRSAFKTTALLELFIFEHPIYWLLKVEGKNEATTFEELRQRPRVDTEAKFKLIQKKFCIICQNTVKTIGRWLHRIPKVKENHTWLLQIMNVLLKLASEFNIVKIIGRWLHGIQKMKENHTWSLQIMNELLQHASDEDMSQLISRTASEQLSMSLQTKEFNELESMATHGTITIETPLMIAAKNGVTEMVEKILELFPSRIKDVNDEGKNILLLAVEYRQTDIYRFLCKQKWLSASLFGKVDKDGNNALHLAARFEVDFDWLNPGEELSIVREIKWFEYAKNSMPRGLSEGYNKKMETPEGIFRESHKQLMKSEGKWAAKTSQAGSVISTLVASVAYATRTSVPGGYDDNSGNANLRNKSPQFKTFAEYSFAAFLFSLFSTICFLSIAASRSQSVQSWRCVPVKLYLGMCFMFLSIVGLWVSFCAANFLILDDYRQK